jgi:UDPglucose 6-dehydrogenase
MRICVIGSGYVGLVTGACLADSGNQVTCIDSDAAKIAALSRGESTIFEPGLADLLHRNGQVGRLRFATDLAGPVAEARVIFIAVGTPARDDGSADLSAVESVAEAVGRAIRPHAVVVMKSTVPVGACDRIEAIIAASTNVPFAVLSNPEFLKEGTAVEDFLRPDRVVIGATDDEAAALVAELYKPFVRNNKPIQRVGRRAAEMCKYAANAYLATRISFINEIAAICERFDVDVDEVRLAMGSDARIGHHFLYPGLGYGGSCFPKDVQALADSARRAGVECRVLEAVHFRNLAQRRQMLSAIRGRLGPNLRGVRLAVWGLAFKPNTDDVRDAPAIEIIRRLVEDGAQVAAYDPEAAAGARAALRGERVEFGTDAYEVLRGAHALLICTEWMEFRSPDFERMRAALVQPLVFDGRNIYDTRMMRRYRFEYYSVGRPAVRAAGGAAAEGS